MFFGQLPYTATEDQIRRFIDRKGIEGYTVRILTDKTTKKSRGMAFVEFKRDRDAEEALKLDYSLFLGRRIRVERTAVGGGKNARRDGRNSRAKKTQEEERLTHVRTLLDEAFARQTRRRARASDPDRAAMAQDPGLHPSRRPVQVAPWSESGPKPVFMGRDDCDADVEKFVKSLPEIIAAKVVRTLAKIRVEGVENRAAYAMGVVKRRLRRKEKQSLIKPDSAKEDKAAALPSPAEVRSSKQRGGEALFYS